MAHKKHYDDDDGRTIASMDQVSAPSLFGKHKEPAHEKKDLNDSDSAQRRYNTAMPRENRRWVIFGALKATFLIAFAFLAGLALIIVLMILIWS